MRDCFYDLTQRLFTQLAPGEVLLCNLHGEESDFVRFNRARVRQAGRVSQYALELELILDGRHALAHCGLAGDSERDFPLLRSMLGGLRQQCAHLPADPFLNFCSEPVDSEQVIEAVLPPAAEAVAAIAAGAAGLDLVGIWASGPVFRGFASSLGQRNWHSSATFNLDWSCYLQGDKAVKGNYAGFDWDPHAFAHTLAGVRGRLEAMARPARSLQPGRYRAYLAPQALQEILDLLGWEAFGLKSHRTAETPLYRMVKEGKRLHPQVTLQEDNRRGASPAFTSAGFVKPPRVVLIEQGAYGDCLVDARSGKQYGAPVNAEAESPESLGMTPGEIPAEEVLERLDTGLYIGNLWYCNFSDPNECRVTGMTRFATFWVEHGRIQAPVEVMRFDDSLYHMLGDGLVGLTRERQLLLATDTYGGRSTASCLLPGALLEDMAFTL